MVSRSRRILTAAYVGAGVIGGGGFTPLAISGTPDAATVGTPYSFTPIVIGGSGTKTFALTGPWPAGLSINPATGVVSGTPTTAGISSGLGVSVSDNSGSASLTGKSLTVNAAPVAPTMVARNAVAMTGPGHAAAALLTGDGTEKTYSIDFQNVSGAPMTTASLVTLGWQVQGDGAAPQKLSVGNDVTITSATIEYPIGSGQTANMDVGVTPNGGLRSGNGVALAAAIPQGATGRLIMKATPPNAQKYSANFGLAGIRTHAMSDTIHIAGMGIGDSFSTTDGSYSLDAAKESYPWTQMSIIGNKLQRAAVYADDYAAVAEALNARLFCLFGSNDFGSRTLAQMQADIGLFATAMAARNRPFHPYTLPPNVSSANGTYALDDQTKNASDAVRTAFNDWVRTNGFDYFEMADNLETARNSGIWVYGSAYSYHLTDNEDVTCSAVTSQTNMNFAGMKTSSAVGSAAVLLATSGANLGQTRLVNSIVGSAILLSSAFPNAVAVGDTFTLKPQTNKGTTDGVHLMGPYAGGVQYGGWFIARDAIKNFMLAKLAANGKAPYVQWGYVDTGAAAGTAASAAVPFPTNTRVGDRSFIICASANQPVSAPAGWTERAKAQSGAAGATGAVCCQLFEKNTAYAVTDVAPTISAEGGNHIVYRMFNVRAAKRTGSCVAEVATAIDTSASVNGAFPAVVAADKGCLILNLLADETDIATARVSGESNANLIGLAERYDGGNVTGNGSGIAIYSGMLPAAGSSGQTAFVHAQTTDKALITVAIKRDI